MLEQACPSALAIAPLHVCVTPGSVRCPSSHGGAMFALTFSRAWYRRRRARSDLQATGKTEPAADRRSTRHRPRRPLPGSSDRPRRPPWPSAAACRGHPVARTCLTPPRRVRNERGTCQDCIVIQWAVMAILGDTSGLVAALRSVQSDKSGRVVVAMQPSVHMERLTEFWNGRAMQSPARYEFASPRPVLS